MIDVQKVKRHIALAEREIRALKANNHDASRPRNEVRWLIALRQQARHKIGTGLNPQGSESAPVGFADGYKRAGR